MAVSSGSRSLEGVRERVRSASDIAEVVGQFVSLRKVGRSWKGLCPFHQEKTPSFTVSPERQTYHCFGCDQGGDVFRFIEEMEKVSFPEALRILGERAGIEIPRYQRQADSAEALYQACDEAAEFYRRWLLDEKSGRQARDLLRSRGVEKDVEEKFGLGYAPPGWDALSSRIASRHGEATLVRAGLAAPRDGGRGVYDRFRDRLVVPLRTPGGRVVGFGGRAVGGGEPKYLNPPETPVYRKGEFLFGLGEARERFRETRTALLVEGYFDALVLHQAGFTDAVAVGGTALTAEQARLLARYVDRVLVALDGDEAGRTASRRSLAPLANAGLEVKVVLIPQGDDPDSLVRSQGPEVMRELTESAPSAAGFLCLDADGSTAARERALAEVLDLAASLEGLPAREGLLVEADRRLGVGLERLRAAVAEKGVRISGRRGVPGGEGGEPEDRPAVSFEDEAVPYLERSLLELVCASSEMAEEASRRLPADWLEHAASRAVWEAVCGEPGGGAAAWIRNTTGQARALLTSTASSAVLSAEPGRALEDHLRRLEARHLALEQEDLRRRLGTAAAEENQAENLGRLQTIATRLRELSSGGEVVAKGESE
jgi:DNA primase